MKPGRAKTAAAEVAEAAVAAVDTAAVVEEAAVASAAAAVVAAATEAVEEAAADAIATDPSHGEQIDQTPALRRGGFRLIHLSHRQSSRQHWQGILPGTRPRRVGRGSSSSCRASRVRRRNPRS